MIRTGIIGGAGYTAGELIRILVNHPYVEIMWVNSTSNAGNRIADVHSGLDGDTDLCFTAMPDMSAIDMLFLCSGHGESRRFFESHAVPESVRIIDLAQDYRDETDDFVYGLPEINGERITKARKVANPGCFATAIQLSVLPAVAACAVKGEIHVTAVTGSTGAGVKPSATTHFSWRNDNLSTYKEFSHQHLAEINRTLGRLTPGGSLSPVVNFVPVRGDFARGIFATVYFETDLDEGELEELYEDFYGNASFVHVVDRPVDLKQVVNTNKALLHVGKHGTKAHVVTAIDNLLKGASGQAVQNMNLMFGLDPKTGLRLKASAF